MQKEKLEFLTAKARKLRDDAIEIIGHFISAWVTSAARCPSWTRSR